MARIESNPAQGAGPVTIEPPVTDASKATGATAPAGTTLRDGVDARPTNPTEVRPEPPARPVDPAAAAQAEDGVLRYRGQPALAPTAPPSQAATVAKETQAPGENKNGKVDEKFIDAREGQKTNGEVPTKKNGEAGVTVARGFSLGSKSEGDLKKMGLSDALIKKLAPHLGKKGAEAEASLKETPLKITQAEAQQIDRANTKNTTENVSKSYEQASGGKKFMDLPQEAQTMIVSIALQYGDLATQQPRFFNAITKQDWRKAEQQLRNCKDEDCAARRNQEADLIKPLVRRAGD